jgi:hypothetical protein
MFFIISKSGTNIGAYTASLPHLLHCQRYIGQIVGKISIKLLLICYTSFNCASGTVVREFSHFETTAVAIALPITLVAERPMSRR